MSLQILLCIKATPHDWMYRHPPPIPAPPPPPNQSRRDSSLASLRSSNVAVEVLSARNLCKLFTPKAALCKSHFELVIDSLLFVSYPLLLADHDDRKKDVEDNDSDAGGCDTYVSDDDSTAKQKPAPSPTQTLHLVNVVFALQRDKVDHKLLAKYKDAAAKLSIALKSEQERCGYLSSEIALMQGAHQHDEGDSDIQVLTNMSGRSSLGNLIEHVYDQLVDHKFVHVLVNDWVDVSISLKV
eukprot:GFYU01023605.1.p1 GENE.GFYU01023605.1~~GFYU01023605.1.p1  ORF type:complete len:241 (-),score=38.52 GFYU01023605.1:25-747(-)